MSRYCAYCGLYIHVDPFYSDAQQEWFCDVFCAQEELDKPPDIQLELPLVPP